MHIVVSCPCYITASRTKHFEKQINFPQPCSQAPDEVRKSSKLKATEYYKVFCFLLANPAHLTCIAIFCPI